MRYLKNSQTIWTSFEVGHRAHRAKLDVQHQILLGSSQLLQCQALNLKALNLKALNLRYNVKHATTHATFNLPAGA